MFGDGPQGCSSACRYIGSAPSGGATETGVVAYSSFELRSSGKSCDGVGACTGVFVCLKPVDRSLRTKQCACREASTRGGGSEISATSSKRWSGLGHKPMVHETFDNLQSAGKALRTQ